MDWVHTGLDVAGMVPIVGNAADLANAGLYAVEGDALNAGISLAGAIPGVGQAATGARLGAKAAKEAAERLAKEAAEKAAKEAAEKAAKEATEKLAKEAAEKEAKEKAAQEAAEKNIGTKVSEAPPKSVTTPNAAAKKQVQGEYTDPLSNKTIQTPNKLEADHIFPKKEIENLPGFDKLTPQQQSAVLNNPKNFQGLPKTYNASKGSKTDWGTYKGQSLDPAYQQNLSQLQKQNQQVLQDQIDGFLK